MGSGGPLRLATDLAAAYKSVDLSPWIRRAHCTHSTTGLPFYSADALQVHRESVQGGNLLAAAPQALIPTETSLRSKILFLWLTFGGKALSKLA